MDEQETKWDIATLILAIVAVMAIALWGQGCVNQPPTAFPDEARIEWDHEPTVGVRDDDVETLARLRDLTQNAIHAWHWGRYVGSCDRADVCVTLGFYEGFGVLGRAHWMPGEQRCDVQVMALIDILVAHEIGHCYGMGHSADARSVMAEYVADDLFQFITVADRYVMDSIIREVGE